MNVLSVLIPVYNEQAYLRRLVDRVVAAKLPEGLSKELIIVDDCSTDRTPEVIESLLNQNYLNVTIKAFKQPQNAGKGAAIRRAIEEMCGDYAIIQDADLEYDPNDYEAVLRPILEGRADVVYGSRFAPREMKKVLFYHHKQANVFLTFLSNITSGLDLTDMETCYKAFRSEVLKSIPLRSNRFGIEPEITAKIAKRGFSVYEVPISYHGRQYYQGKKINWRDGISAVWTIFKYWVIDDCYFDSDEFRIRSTPDFSRNYLIGVVDRSLPYCGNTILQLEAGIGLMSRFLPQKERLCLTESNPKSLAVLENMYDGNAIVDIRSFDLSDHESAPPGKFDTVLMFDYLQLQDDEKQVLLRAKELLGESGKLLITVPHHPWLFGSMDKIRGNRRRYTKKQIKKVLAESGYKVVRCQNFNSLSFIVWFLNFVVLKRKKIGKWQLKLLDLCFPVTSFFERFLPHPGANLFLVAEPQKINREGTKFS